MSINLSYEESAAMGIRVGRGVKTVLTSDSLLSEMIAGEFDMCRLKIQGDNDSLFNHLDSLGIPYSVNSILLRNSRICKKVPVKLPDNLEFAEYDDSKKTVLERLVLKATQSFTGLNFQHRFLGELFTKEEYVNATVKYASSFNNTHDPEKYGWLIKYNGDYVGYNLGTRLSETEFEGVLIGVLPEFRNLGLSTAVYAHFLGHVFPEMGITKFYNDVQIQNFASLKSSFKEGVFPINSFLNVVVLPFFGNLMEKRAISSVEEFQRAIKSVIGRNQHRLTEFRVSIKSELLIPNQVCFYSKTSSSETRLITFVGYSGDEVYAVGYFHLQ